MNFTHSQLQTLFQVKCMSKHNLNFQILDLNFNFKYCSICSNLFVLLFLFNPFQKKNVFFPFWQLFNINFPTWLLLIFCLRAQDSKVLFTLCQVKTIQSDWNRRSTFFDLNIIQFISKRLPFFTFRRSSNHFIHMSNSQP